MSSASFSKTKMLETKKFNWRQFKDEQLRRSFVRVITLLGDSGITDPIKLLNWKKTKNEMSRIFNIAKVEVNGSLLSLEPDISSLFQTSRNYDQLSGVWKSWRDESGAKFGDLYPKYVSLSNEATYEYGFRDYGEYVRLSFETDNLGEQFDRIYEKLRHLYRMLHSYVRTKLSKDVYADKMDPRLGAMPAHVLGDMWAQQWHNVFNEIKPYKNVSLLDGNPKMLEKVDLK